MFRKIINWMMAHDTAVIAGFAALLFTRYAVDLMFKLCLFSFVACTFYYVVLQGGLL